MQYRSWARSRGNRLPAAIYETPRPIHVILGTARGRPLLELPALAEAAFGPLVEHPLTLAACVLRDHVHWLLEDSSGISENVGKYKSLVTARARARGYSPQLWQRSFWDHVIRSPEKLDRVARYVVENPIRAGLCQSMDDYPYVVFYPERIDSHR